MMAAVAFSSLLNSDERRLATVATSNTNEINNTQLGKQVPFYNPPSVGSYGVYTATANVTTLSLSGKGAALDRKFSTDTIIVDDFWGVQSYRESIVNHILAHNLWRSTL